MFPLLPPDAHEALCRRCGMSCHTPILLGDKTLIVPELHCRFLGRDAEDNPCCTVYENRFERAPWCRTAQEAALSGGLAHDCPYVRSIPGYRGKHWADPQERLALLPMIRRAVIENGLPAHDDPDAVLPILEIDGSHWSYTISPDGSRYLFRRDD